MPPNDQIPEVLDPALVARSSQVVPCCSTAVCYVNLQQNVVVCTRSMDTCCTFSVVLLEMSVVLLEMKSFTTFIV